MAAVASNHEQEYGLSYDSDFLNSLPVLSPPVASPSCSTSPESQPLPSHLPPIRSVSASQFADMHLRYLTTHAPDSVIFPFLHGLEGDNDAQNAFFFANGSMTAVNGSTALGKDGVDTIDREKLKARVPRFRGLVWVASDEDEVEEYERAMKARDQGHSSDLHSSRTQDDFDDDIEDDIEEDDYSTSSLDDDDEVEDDDFAAMPMDIDDHVDLNAGVVGMDVDLHGQHDGGLLDHGEGAHMHPVVHAHRPALSAIDTGSKAHGHRLSNASSTSSFNSTASDEPSTSASPSPPPSATSASPCLPSPPTPPTSLPATPATPQLPETSRPRDVPDRVTLTSTFKPRELLCIDRETGETRFVEPKVPDGISLRNFGIQVPIFATLSDIVVYSPRGNTKAALAVASHFAHAVETKRRQRAARGQTDLLHYNVFVLRATPEEMVRELSHVVSRMADEVVGSGAHTSGTDALTVTETHGADSHPLTKHQQCTMRKANTISFAQREKDEMRELTQASEIMTLPVKDEEELKEFSATTPASKWDPTKGQVFLGNANDVPFPPTNNSNRKDRTLQDEWESKSNDPALGYGYDICIECDDMAPFPSPAHMRAAEEHVARLEKRWADHCLQEMEKAEGSVDGAREIPVRPPPSAGLVVHLPFPSTVMYAGNSVLPFVSWLEGLMKPVEHPLTVAELRERKEREAEAKRIVAVSSNTRAQNRRSTNAATVGHSAGHSFGGPSSLPPPTAFPTSFFPVTGSSPAVPATSTVNAFTRMRSTSATQLSTPSSPAIPLAPIRTRPLKILVYSADGYTESSSLALCLLMSLRRLNLPEAYLELQVEKRRSFFVYQNEMGPLKRIEARLERDRLAQAGMLTKSRSSANSVSFAPSSIPNSFLSSLGPASHPGMLGGEALSSSAPSPTNDLALVKRPRASTLPPTSSIVSNHQMWFDDPRFDGSFPSRVLPFLYLGNLNHAANAYMLHALGITHVVSVGECALIPPENAGSHYPTTAKPGSLWIEEKEGRIKVLDIKDVCDDGIDSLEPQLPPICEWIDEARRTGGKVLVHCRVGVSRSATVTIAYVMKHLNIPLVDAYLIVRSRRLSVLIQPNMRLLYNLIGWEIKLAQERAAGDKDRLAEELARCLNWPYLAKEVHALNEKYLH